MRRLLVQCAVALSLSCTARMLKKIEKKTNNAGIVYDNQSQANAHFQARDHLLRDFQIPSPYSGKAGAAQLPPPHPKPQTNRTPPPRISSRDASFSNQGLLLRHKDPAQTPSPLVRPRPNTQSCIARQIKEPHSLRQDIAPPFFLSLGKHDQGLYKYVDLARMSCAPSAFAIAVQYLIYDASETSRPSVLFVSVNTVLHRLLGKKARR